MNWQRMWSRIKGRSRAFDQDLNDEIAFHQAMKEREYRESGLDSDDAMLAARRSIGNLTLLHEDARAAWRFQWISDLFGDLRYGARSLYAQPGFTAAATLALTLGLGLTGTIFSVYNALALAPWAIRDPGRTVQVLSDRGGRWNGFSWPEYRYLRDNSRTMAALTASDNTGVRVSRGESSWSASAVAAAENFFDALGTGFAAGRGFSPGGPDLKNPAPEVVLHYDMWQRRFGGDHGIVGQWLELSGHRLQVVGVAAAGFSGPTPNIPDLWIPAPWRDIMNPGPRWIDTPDSCCTQVVGRLRQDADRTTAQAELTTLSAQFRQSIKRETSRVLLTTPSILGNPTMHSKVAPVFLMVSIAALLILLLACTNVANLLLARGAARRREIAVRLSLGAGRLRILRQLLAESLLLSLLAGSFTLLIASWLPAVIVRWVIPPDDRIAFRFATDWRVVAFVLVVSFTTTMLFALLPAIHAVRDGVAAGLHEAGGRVTSRNRLRFVLLTVQVALCATLLSGASLLLRAMQQAGKIDPGFRHADVILLSPGLQSSGLSDEQVQAPIDTLRARLAGLPGAISIAHATVVPLGNTFNSTSVPDPHSKEQVRTGVTQVSAGFFETLGIPVLTGRPFTAADETRKDLVIVSQTLANRLWPGESPLGKSIGTRQIVGVVRDVATRELGSPADPQMYLPSKGTRGVSFFLRHTGPAALLLSETPKLAHGVDRRFFASAVPYSENVDRARRSAAVAASLSSMFSAIALGLAFVGLYAVAAYQVAQRTREIGVRIALGARPSQILGLMIRQNMRPVVVGGAAGIAGAVALARLLSSLLYGLSPADPLALMMTIAMLFATAAVAVWTPARRAATLDPSSALRRE